MLHSSASAIVGSLDASGKRPGDSMARTAAPVTPILRPSSACPMPFASRICLMASVLTPPSACVNLNVLNA